MQTNLTLRTIFDVVQFKLAFNIEIPFFWHPGYSNEFNYKKCGKPLNYNTIIFQRSCFWHSKKPTKRVPNAKYQHLAAEHFVNTAKVILLPNLHSL